jgi:hypothetical protein
MAKIPNSIGITGLLAPKDSADKYAIYDAQFMKGGLHSVTTIAERDALPTERRAVGMLCAVADDGLGRAKVYQLVGGITNASWVDFAGAGGGVGIKSVATLTERDAILEDDRFEGMQVLVYNEPTLERPTTFILIGGITNDKWVEDEVPTIDPNTIIWRGSWNNTAVYSRGSLVSAEFRHYTDSKGSYTKRALLVCKAEASTISQNFPPLTEFDIVGSYDVGNIELSVSVTHGFIWVAPEDNEENSYEYGNIILVPNKALLLCKQNIDSVDPLDPSEASSWETIFNFESWYTKTEVDALLGTLSTNIGNIESAIELITNDDGDGLLDIVSDKVNAISNDADTGTLDLLEGKVDTITNSSSTGRLDVAESDITSLKSNLQYLKNDFIKVETLAERDALASVTGITLIEDGTIVFVYNEPTLNGVPTSFMWDETNSSWIPQQKIDPETMVWRGQWNDTTQYKAGDIITSGDTFYIGLNDSLDADPTDESNNDKWKIMGGAPDLYDRDEAAYSTVGNITAGTNMNGWSWQDYITAQHFPYQAPAFTSFTLSGQAATVEVGGTVPANLEFTYVVSNTANVKSGVGFTVTDVTNTTTIASNVTASPVTTTSAAVTQNSAVTQTYRISGTNNQEQEFSKEVSINFRWAMYIGESDQTSLDVAAVKALRAKSLGTTPKGTHTYIAGGYKYLVYPTTWGQVIDFKDSETGFGVAMLDPEILSFTNDNSVIQNYYVYRTVNTLAAGLILVVN